MSKETRKRSGLRSRLITKLRPKAQPADSGDVSNAPNPFGSADEQPDLHVALLEAHREKYKDAHQAIDLQLGERRDYTELLHALGKPDQFDSDVSPEESLYATEFDGEDRVASLSPELWDIVTDYLEPLDAAHLTVSSRVLYTKLAPRPLHQLNRAENYGAKIEFLLEMDSKLPGHLLCFPCSQYHRRLEPGEERLLSSGTQASKPVFQCPQARHAGRPPPRLQIAPGRSLQFQFVQLVSRSARYGPDFGLMPERLNRRWTHAMWRHTSRFIIRNGHLLMRVTSQAPTSSNLTISGKRILLFNRDDYAPYWSVCAHWKHGELTSVAKCALDHVPAASNSAGLVGIETRMKNELNGIKGRHNAASSYGWASQCGTCQPLRRCTECPTEYLVEVKLVEETPSDSKVKRTTKLSMPGWCHAIVVTRWSDLGTGISPFQPEWAACTGMSDKAFDSFSQLKKRSLAGTFESTTTGETPTQQILSLNPRGRRRQGMNEDTWY